VWVIREGEMTRAEKEGRVKQMPGSISLSFTGIMEEKMKNINLTTVYFAGSLEAIYHTYATEVHTRAER